MAKTSSWVFGVILVIAGVWGFFIQPAVGFIAADTMSSIMHVIAGVVLLALATKSSAGMALKVIGIIYVVWALLGFLSWNFVAADGVTNWFYLVVGIVVAALGWSAKDGGAAPAAPQM
ncbi:MAG: hypothetical protein WCV82_02940 [Candidatus Paceibacterota bacterium]